MKDIKDNQQNIIEKDHYNEIISKSGGVSTTVAKLQFLEDYVTRQEELDSGKRIRSNSSPRIMIPKKWFRRKSQGKITKYWENNSSSNSSDS